MTNNINESPEELFSFYEEKLRYYSYWAKHHRINYWILLWLTLTAGVSLGGAMIFQANAQLITILALSLNVLLIVSKAIGTDDKYIRYRTTEINLQFLLQSMKTDIANSIEQGQSQNQALITAVKKYHPEFKEIVTSEFAEHFSKQKSLEKINFLAKDSFSNKKN